MSKKLLLLLTLMVASPAQSAFAIAGTAPEEVYCSDQYIPVTPYNNSELTGGIGYTTSAVTYPTGLVTYDPQVPVDSCPPVEKGTKEICIPYDTATTALKNQACSNALSEIPGGTCATENGACVKCSSSPPPKPGKCKRLSSAPVSRPCTFVTRTVDEQQRICAQASKYCGYVCAPN